MMVTLFVLTSNANKVRTNDLILLFKAESTHGLRKVGQMKQEMAHLRGC
jgi:hypothetical protein